MKAVNCIYKEHDRRVTDQFINDLGNEVIIKEITREIIALKDTNEVNSDQILMWAKRVEAQRVQKVLKNMRCKGI